MSQITMEKVEREKEEKPSCLPVGILCTAGGFILGWIIKNLIEGGIPEVGLILISPSKTYTRGFQGYHDLNLENLGDDNVTQVKAKLEDKEGIFDKFEVCFDRHWEHPYLIRLYESVLNRFQEHHLWNTNDSYNFPAGITRTFKCGGQMGGYGYPYNNGVIVKPDAPLGVHTLVWHLEYMVYESPLQSKVIEIPWEITIYPAGETTVIERITSSCPVCGQTLDDTKLGTDIKCSRCGFISAWTRKLSR